MKTGKISVIEKTAKAVFALCAGSVLGLSFGCISEEPTVEKENGTPKYSIGGTVTTSDGGGASGASVLLQNAADGSNLGQTTTDAGGAYAFSGLSAGTYKIGVTLSGYETGSIADVKITDGNVTINKIVLQKITVATYTISGVASLSGGGAAAGATVQIRKTGDTTLVGQAATPNGSGAY